MRRENRWKWYGSLQVIGVNGSGERVKSLEERSKVEGGRM